MKPRTQREIENTLDDDNYWWQQIDADESAQLRYSEEMQDGEDSLMDNGYE